MPGYRRRVRRKPIFRRRRKVFRRRRTFGRRKGKPTSLALRGPTGFPDKIRVKLNYYCTLNFTLSNLNGAYYVFRGNSLFDPEYASGGGQPYAFDQWGQFYNHYRVYGSSIKVISCLPNSDTFENYPSMQGATLAITPSVDINSLGTYVDAYEFREMPYTRIKGSTMYSPIRNLKNYMSTAKITGVSKVAVKAESDYSANIVSNPNKQWFWVMYMLPPTAVSNTAIWEVAIKITYYAEFYGRYMLGRS